jgi:pSer/pThr/pTyr-binding forkhead associated (FHA) protein
VRLRFRIRTTAAPEAPSGTGTSVSVDRLVEAEPAGGEVRIGRRAGMEIELPFPTVSGLHARIFRHGGAWAIADLGSANGTFLADTRLGAGTPQPLRQGQVVRLADVLLTFEGELGGAQPAGADAVEGTATMARRLVNDLFQSMPAAEVARVVVTAGPSAGRALVLTQPDRAYRVGRAPECDLVLADDDVSREHATFERRWQGVFVRDLGSKNGIEQAGKRLGAEHKLGDGDVVVLGASELRIEDPEERYLRRMEDEALARVQASTPAPRPTPPTATRQPTPVSVAARPPAGHRPRAATPLIVAALALVVLAGVGYLLWSFLFAAPRIE